MKYVHSEFKKDEEISKQNDMELKIKREKALSTAYVKCPYCGADNLISQKVGVCSYCRRKLENKAFKESH